MSDDIVNFTDDVRVPRIDSTTNGYPIDMASIVHEGTTYKRQRVDVSFIDNSNVDALGRLRTSTPHGIFDSKQISSNDDDGYEELLVGTATATFQYPRSSTYLTIGTASGDRAVRQTTRYFAYVPGTSHLISCTGIFAPAKANLNQYIGYGDDYDGLFFTLQGVTPGVMVRSSVTDTPVNTFIPRTTWNIDKFDGTGPSGVTLDLTKVQIFMINFQWLGAGRIRFSFNVDGFQQICHEINNANVVTAPFMTTPTLPIRYEIANVGITASASTLEQICCSILGEGAYAIPGSKWSAGNGLTRRAVTTRTPVFAIRLKNFYPATRPNRRSVKLNSFEVTTTTNDALIELAHVHAPLSITATWTDVDASSGVEYSRDISVLTASHIHIIDESVLFSGQAGKGGRVEVNEEFINAHSYISQNMDSTNSEMYVIYATSASGTANVSASITWIEIE